MKRKARGLLLIILVVGCGLVMSTLFDSPRGWAAEVTVADLLSSPERYDQQEVTVQGTARRVELGTGGRIGMAKTTFKLADGSGKAVSGMPARGWDESETVTDPTQQPFSPCISH